MWHFFLSRLKIWSTENPIKILLLEKYKFIKFNKVIEKVHLSSKK